MLLATFLITARNVYDLRYSQIVSMLLFTYARSLASAKLWISHTAILPKLSDFEHRCITTFNVGKFCIHCSHVRRSLLVTVSSHPMSREYKLWRRILTCNTNGAANPNGSYRAGYRQHVSTRSCRIIDRNIESKAVRVH